MGYLVYQNHTELGYRSSVKNSNTQTKARNPTQRRKAQLEVLIKAGHYTAARDLAAKIIKHGAPLWEWERIFKLYCAAKPSANIDKYFASYATKLIEANEYEKLADATLLIKRVMPDFSIANHDHKLECANALLSVGKHVIGINMIKNLPNESQDSEVIGRALELLAKAYNHVPGGERSAKNFHSLHTQHIAKYQT